MESTFLKTKEQKINCILERNGGTARKMAFNKTVNLQMTGKNKILKAAQNFCIAE